MKDKIKKKWDEIMNLLQTEYDVSEVIVNTWIRTLEIYEVQNNTVYFYVEEIKGRHGVEYLRKRGYDLFLLSSIRQALNDSSINIEIDEKSAFFKAESKALSEDASSGSFSGESASDYIRSIRDGHLNPTYTFENFVVGDGNQHAYATCTMVADLPCQNSMNPLFIYGGSGLGKTHLIQSIAHFIIQHDQTKRVLYVSSETFTNEIIKAINKNATEEFRNKYRQVDVLIIDDIQEIIGRESTQKEFFNTFNVLYDAGKQIILSSDRPPREIKTLDERLLSRFEWGVPIDIHAPDYETRMAILKNKVELNHYKNISDDVLQYIAENIVSNVRELEGALKKINFFTILSNTPMTVEKAKDTLKDFISKDKEVDVTPESILAIVSEHMDISIDDIKSKKRSADISIARQLVMYLCRNLTDRSLQAIGEVVDKDHSTISSGVKKIEKKMKEDPEFNSKVEVIIKKINPRN